VDVTYEGLNVPRSPFSVNVVPGCDPSRVRAYGPGKAYPSNFDCIVSFLS